MRGMVKTLKIVCHPRNPLVMAGLVVASSKGMTTPSSLLPTPMPTVRDPVAVQTTIGGLLPDPVPFTREELGYSIGLIRQHPDGRDYVVRQCDGGCLRRLEFTPLPHFSRAQVCSVCKRKTWWRVVP